MKFWTSTVVFGLLTTLHLLLRLPIVLRTCQLILLSGYMLVLTAGSATTS